MKTVFEQIKDMDMPEFAVLLLQFFEAGKFDGNLWEVIGDMPIVKWLESTEEVYVDVPVYLMKKD